MIKIKFWTKKRLLEQCVPKKEETLSVTNDLDA